MFIESLTISETLTFTGTFLSMSFGISSMCDEMNTGSAFQCVIFLLTASVVAVYTFRNGWRYSPLKSGFKNETEQNDSNKSFILSDRKIILVVAYMRTGSTMTAALLQEYPGTFYAYEPIRNIYNKHKRIKKGQVLILHYVNGKDRSYSFSNKIDVIFDEIKSWLTCKLDSLWAGTLTDKGHKLQTKLMKQFYECIVDGTLIQANGSVLAKHRKTVNCCFDMIINLCKVAPYLLFKFIRLKMMDVARLMPLYPNMKVIHLVRDPRGIINSKLNVLNFIKLEDYPNHVQSHCTLIKENLKYSKQIMENFPGRLKIIRYEDIAANTLKTVRGLFEFVGIPFETHLQVFVRNLTKARKNSNKWGIQRANSTQTSMKWRHMLDPQVAGYTYLKCNTSNRILGYLPIKSLKEMQNDSIPSIETVDIYKKLRQYEDVL